MASANKLSRGGQNESKDIRGRLVLLEAAASGELSGDVAIVDNEVNPLRLDKEVRSLL